jgi:flagellar biosynthesis protein
MEKKQKKAKKSNLRKYLTDLNLPEKSKLRAVALKYDLKKDKAPKITAVGRGKIAETILKVAEENQIPFYEDPNLTNLLAKLEFDTEIPPALFTMVAEVLAFVYQLEKMSKKRQKIETKYGKKR